MREIRSDIQFVDEYCRLFKEIFPQVRSFEAFKLLHLGMISDIQCKSLPTIAKALQLDNQQNLHHFLTESPWTVQKLRQKRLELILKILNGNAIILLLDETGDCKKGRSTDYAAYQYTGNVGEKNCIVTITAYGLINEMILPLTFEVYKPKERLKDRDKHQAKLQIATAIIQRLKAMGFVFEMILADIINDSNENFCSNYNYGIKNAFSLFNKLNLPYILTLRECIKRQSRYMHSNKRICIRSKSYGMPLCCYNTNFPDYGISLFSSCTVVYEKLHRQIHWDCIPIPQLVSGGLTEFNADSLIFKLKNIANQAGYRAWLEYDLKEAKDALGWSDFRMISYEHIERWWEIVMSVFLMISLFADAFNDECSLAYRQFIQHTWWGKQSGWKHLLNSRWLND